MAKRNNPNVPASKARAPRGVPAGPKGLIALLGKLLPFLQVTPPSHKSAMPRSDAKSHTHAARRRRRHRHRRVRVRAVPSHTASPARVGERVALTKQSPPPQSAPALPQTDVTPPPAERSHGIWRLHAPAKPISTPPPPAQASVYSEGVLGFFRHLFDHAPASTQTPAPASTDAAVPSSPLASDGKNQAPALSLDLDSLLTGNAPPVSGAKQSKPETKKELPAKELMEPSASPSAPTPVPASPTVNPQAGAQTSKGKFVSAKEQSDADGKAHDIALQEATDARREKALRQAQDDKKKEEAAARATKELADAPVVAPRVMRHNSGLRELLGAFKYFGMGRERISIVQNLATMLNAGLPLVDAIKTLQVEARARPMRAMLGRINDLVENGSPLWRAMEDQHFFSPHAIALIRIGEEAGNLAENMEYLSMQQEKDQALRSKVTMAMIYPSIVMTMMFIIVVGLGWFVLPNLISVLFSLNVPLPLVTRLVIGFTTLFTNYGAIAVPGAVGGIFVLIILCKFTGLRVVSQWVLFRIPGMGRLAREATIARFGVILGSLLQAGVPLIDALRSLAEVTPIVAYRKFYQKLLDSINVGNSFSVSFATIRGARKLLPPSVQQLIVTGEKSGSLAKILLKIADIYEKKANDTAQKLPVILEPLILLFIGALVATIAFAIIVPIYSIVGNVGNS